MTFQNIIITLIIGILMLIGGIATKKKWLILISVIPLIVALGSIAMLFLMAL